MAISFIAAGAVATGTNPTVAVPAGYQQADLLVLTVAVGAAVAPTTPSGWTLVGSQTTTPRIYIYRKFAAGTESSVALTVASSTTAAVMTCYRGVSATDTVSTFATATATTVATNTLTTSFANEYVISVYAMTTGVATWTAPGSTTSRVNSAGTAALAGILIVDELQAAAGTSTARTATSSVSKALAAGSFSIIPSDRYWVGGAGTWNTTSTTNWSFSSGGASGAPVPTAQDSVFFNQAGTYTVTCTGALTCLDITVSAGTVTFAQGTAPTFAISGSMTLLAGTVWSNTGAITFNATATGKTITTNGVTLSGTVTFNGSGGVWTLGSALSNSEAFTVTSGTLNTSASNFNITTAGIFTVNGGTLTLNGSTLTVTRGQGQAFNYTSGTVNAGTSTISFTGAPSAWLDGGGRTYYNVTWASSITDAQITDGGNTFNNITMPGRSTAGVSTLLITGNQIINGTLTLSAGTNVTCRTLLQGFPSGTASTLTCAAVASLTDIDFNDITIAGAAAPVSGTRLGDCKGNSGITFGAGVTRYWNLAAGGNWSATGWAASSGASPALNNFPLAQDTAIFEATGLNSGATVTINGNYNIGTINMSARTGNTMTLATGVTTPVIYGNWINGTGTTLSGTGSITFSGRTTQTITTAGKTFTQGFTINSPSGTITLQDSLTTDLASAGAITLTNGTLNLNGQTLTLSATATATFRTLTGTKNLTFNGGSLVIAASGTTAFNNLAPTGFTTTAGTGTGTISLTSSSAKTFVGGGSTYNCTLNQGGGGTLTITGANTFSNITNTYNATGATSILFTAGTTSTFTDWNASGAFGNLLTIGSVTAASHTLSKASGTVSADFLSISRSTATGGATWYAGANSTNGGNNSGWIFSAVPGGGNFLMFFN